MSKFNKLFIWVILFQLVILCVIIVKYSYVLFLWKEYLVKTIPVDPRDYLRWDYVTLSYPISSYSWEIVWLKGELDKITWYKVYIIPTIIENNKIDWIKQVLAVKPDSWDYIEWKISSYYGKVDYKLSYMLSGQSIEKDYEGWSSYGFKNWDQIKIVLDNNSNIIEILDLKQKSYYSDYKIIDWKIISYNSHYVYRFDFWADKYFIKENTGKSIEDAIRSWNVYAKWKVLNWKVVIDWLE